MLENNTFKDGIKEMIKMIEKLGATYGAAEIPFEGYILTIRLDKEKPV